MPTLYIVQDAARIEKEYHRLLVTLEDEVLLRVPLRFVSGIVIAGRAGMTTPALHAVLYHKIPVFFTRKTGEILGRLVPPDSAKLELRRTQYKKQEEQDFRLEFARAVTAGKLHNQRILALRIKRRRKEIEEEPLDQIRQVEKSVEQAADLGVLRGLEGSGARAYFSVYRQAFDPAWKFNSRNRRPPRDPVNSLLSLGYTFLGNALVTALELVGLDAYAGLFHEETYGRPALALDLLEEFRAPIVDSLVMGLINRRLLQEDDFEERMTADGKSRGVFLKENGFKVFLREFSDRLESEIHIPGIKKPLSYRKILEIQARRLEHLLMGKADVYRPFAAR